MRSKLCDCESDVITKDLLCLAWFRLSLEEQNARLKEEVQSLKKDVIFLIVYLSNCNLCACFYITYYFSLVTGVTTVMTTLLKTNEFDSEYYVAC